jgi:hypothetical protein
MPEIVNEVPSDSELRAYLNEWLNGSAGFVMLSTNPANCNGYHPEVVEALAYLWAHPLHEVFLERCHASLLNALKRLNGLPRNDAFWRNTNCRPTVFKLAEFGNRVRLKAPDDELTLFTSAFLDVATVGEFHPDLWAHLYRIEAVDVRFVAYVAMLLEITGAPDTDELATFAQETKSVQEVIAFLREVPTESGVVLAEWARRVLTVIESGPGNRLEP